MAHVLALRQTASHCAGQDIATGHEVPRHKGDPIAPHASQPSPLHPRGTRRAHAGPKPRRTGPIDYSSHSSTTSPRPTPPLYPGRARKQIRHGKLHEKIAQNRYNT